MREWVKGTIPIIMWVSEKWKFLGEVHSKGSEGQERAQLQPFGRTRHINRPKKIWETNLTHCQQRYSFLYRPIVLFQYLSCLPSWTAKFTWELWGEITGVHGRGRDVGVWTLLQPAGVLQLWKCGQLHSPSSSSWQLRLKLLLNISSSLWGFFRILSPKEMKVLLTWSPLAPIAKYNERRSK